MFKDYIEILTDSIYNRCIKHLQDISVNNEQTYPEYFRHLGNDTKFYVQFKGFTYNFYIARFSEGFCIRIFNITAKLSNKAPDTLTREMFKPIADYIIRYIYSEPYEDIKNEIIDDEILTKRNKPKEKHHGKVATRK